MNQGINPNNETGSSTPNFFNPKYARQHNKVTAITIFNTILNTKFILFPSTKQKGRLNRETL